MCSFAQLKAASNSCCDRAKLLGSNITPPPAGRLPVFPPGIHRRSSECHLPEPHLLLTGCPRVPRRAQTASRLGLCNGNPGTELSTRQDVRGTRYYQGDASVVLALHKSACLFSHTELDFDKGKRMIQHLIN